MTTAAAWGYFDTSVLVKRYVRENGSVRARSLIKRHRFLSSAIAPLEAVSALTRRRVTGDLAEKDFPVILYRMREDRMYWELIEVTPLVLDRAEELIQETTLRALDALHIASALIFQKASGIRVPFITGDVQQRDAARQLKMDVVWVH